MSKKEFFYEVLDLFKEEKIIVDHQDDENYEIEIIVAENEIETTIKLIIEEDFCIISSYFESSIEEKYHNVLALYFNLNNTILRDGKFFVNNTKNQAIFRIIHYRENSINQIINRMYTAGAMMIYEIENINKIIYKDADYQETFNKKFQKIISTQSGEEITEGANV